MPLQAYQDYRKLFTSTRDEDVAWWYFGQVYLQLPGRPEQAVVQAETIMLYRTKTLAENSCAIKWWEIGYFRDPVTGEIIDEWLNPVTGRTVKAPRSFEEGPATYTITATDTGVDVTLVQHAAKVVRLAVTLEEQDGMFRIDQEEVKRRGFPLPDGTLPDPDSIDAAPARTVLTMYGSRADLDDAAQVAPAGKGAYTFELATPPGWLGLDAATADGGKAIVRGTMIKAAADAILNPIAWQRFKQIFPNRFDGDVIKPVWE